MMNIEAVTKTLGESPLFKNVSTQEIKNILAKANCIVKKFQRGGFIHCSGDSVSSIGIVNSGCVEIKKILPNGKVISVFHRKVGDLICGCAIFSDTSILPYDVLAKDESEIIFFNKADILNVLFKNPAVASNIMRIFSNRILQFENRLELFSYSSIQQKIAFSLLNDFSAEAGIAVTLPFSKTVWAQYLNVSRPSLCRELKALCDRGIISVEKNNITVFDAVALEAIVL